MRHLQYRPVSVLQDSVIGLCVGCYRKDAVWNVLPEPLVAASSAAVCSAAQDSAPLPPRSTHHLPAPV